jgi:hypothetical protein
MGANVVSRPPSLRRPGGHDGEGQARNARDEPPDSAATAAEPPLQILEGNATLDAPCLKLRDINRIG